MRKILLLCFVALITTSTVYAKKKESTAKGATELSDREYWVNIARKISFPVLDAASKDKLKELMPVEQHEGAGRYDFAHLEALGRLLCGISPWLELPSDTSKESLIRDSLLLLSHKAIGNGVNPSSADYMNFTKGSQPLVDAAFLAQAFIRSPKRLWGGLDDATKKMVVDAFLLTRNIRSYENNWLLFSAMIETFFMNFGYPYDMMRIDYAVKQHMQWYKGDGAYGDGKDFHFDYYNSFVIQPMLVDIAIIAASKKRYTEEFKKTILTRSSRYAEVLERMISPEGSYPPIGRSLVYRFGAFQTLSQMALLDKLPKNVSPQQVRCALTAVIKRQMEAKGTFDDKGWLTMGFFGSDKSVGEGYTCTGSTYLCSVGLLALGLDPLHPFWSAPKEAWTQQKAWNGEKFPIDHAISE